MSNVSEFYYNERIRTFWAAVSIAAHLKSFVLELTDGIEDYRTVIADRHYGLIVIPVVPELDLTFEDALYFTRHFEEDKVSMVRYRVIIDEQCYMDGVYEISIGYGKLSNTAVCYIGEARYPIQLGI